MTAFFNALPTWAQPIVAILICLAAGAVFVFIGFQAWRSMVEPEAVRNARLGAMCDRRHPAGRSLDPANAAPLANPDVFDPYAGPVREIPQVPLTGAEHRMAERLLAALAQEQPVTEGGQR